MAFAAGSNDSARSACRRDEPSPLEGKALGVMTYAIELTSGSMPSERHANRPSAADKLEHGSPSKSSVSQGLARVHPEEAESRRDSGIREYFGVFPRSSCSSAASSGTPLLLEPCSKVVVSPPCGLLHHKGRATMQAGVTCTCVLPSTEQNKHNARTCTIGSSAAGAAKSASAFEAKVTHRTVWARVSWCFARFAPISSMLRH